MVNGAGNSYKRVFVPALVLGLSVKAGFDAYRAAPQGHELGYALEWGTITAAGAGLLLYGGMSLVRYINNRLGR